MRLSRGGCLAAVGDVLSRVMWHRLIYSRLTLLGGPARAIVALISITTSILALCEVDVKANDSRCSTNGPNRSENIKKL